MAEAEYHRLLVSGDLDGLVQQGVTDDLLHGLGWQLPPPVQRGSGCFWLARLTRGEYLPQLELGVQVRLEPTLLFPHVLYGTAQ
jgi:hypothetical protein